MSDDVPADFLAPPPFTADEAMVKLRRELRELKPLIEKGTGPVARFDWNGQPVIELSVAPGDRPVLQVALARKPSHRPEWLKHTLTSSADARKLIDEVKRCLKRWDIED